MRPPWFFDVSEEGEGIVDPVKEVGEGGDADSPRGVPGPAEGRDGMNVIANSGLGLFAVWLGRVLASLLGR